MSCEHIEELRIAEGIIDALIEQVTNGHSYLRSAHSLLREALNNPKEPLDNIDWQQLINQEESLRVSDTVQNFHFGSQVRGGAPYKRAKDAVYRLHAENPNPAAPELVATVLRAHGGPLPPRIIREFIAAAFSDRSAFSSTKVANALQHLRKDGRVEARGRGQWYWVTKELTEFRREPTLD